MAGNSVDLGAIMQALETVWANEFLLVFRDPQLEASFRDTFHRIHCTYDLYWSAFALCTTGYVLREESQWQLLSPILYKLHLLYWCLWLTPALLQSSLGARKYAEFRTVWHCLHCLCHLVTMYPMSTLDKAAMPCWKWSAFLVTVLAQPPLFVFGRHLLSVHSFGMCVISFATWCVALWNIREAMDRCGVPPTVLSMANRLWRSKLVCAILPPGFVSCMERLAVLQGKVVLLVFVYALAWWFVSCCMLAYVIERIHREAFLRARRIGFISFDVVVVFVNYIKISMVVLVFALNIVSYDLHKQEVALQHAD